MSELLHDVGEEPGAERSHRIASAVAAIRGGDDCGWKILHDELDGLVRWHARQRFRLGTADVDDISQTVWLQLVRNIDRIEEPAALSGWLSTTTARACIRLANRPASSRELSVEEIWPGVGATDGDPIVDEVICSGLRQEILRVAAALPDRRRRLVDCLLDPNEPDYAEIAKLLDIPAGAIGPTRMRTLRVMADHPAIQALVV